MMSKEELEDSFDLFGDEVFEEDIKGAEESFDLFGDEVFEEDNNSFSDDLFGDDLFGEEEFDNFEVSKLKNSQSNMKDWLSCNGNPELINMEDRNPNNTIFFRSSDFDYEKDYSDIRFIFERFRSELLKGE